MKYNPKRAWPWFGVEVDGKFWCASDANSKRVFVDVTRGKIGEEVTKKEWDWPLGLTHVFRINGGKQKCEECKRSLLDVRKEFQRGNQ